MTNASTSKGMDPFTKVGDGTFHYLWERGCFPLLFQNKLKLEGVYMANGAIFRHSLAFKMECQFVMYIQVG